MHIIIQEPPKIAICWVYGSIILLEYLLKIYTNPRTKRNMLYLSDLIMYSDWGRGNSMCTLRFPSPKSDSD